MYEDWRKEKINLKKIVTKKKLKKGGNKYELQNYIKV